MVIDSITKALALAAASLQMTRNMFTKGEDKKSYEFYNENFQRAANEAAKKLVKRYGADAWQTEKITNSIKLDQEAPGISFDEAIDILGYLYEDADVHESANGKHQVWNMLSELFISAEQNASKNILEELLKSESNKDRIKKTLFENMRKIQEIQSNLDELHQQLKVANNLHRDLLGRPEGEKHPK